MSKYEDLSIKLMMAETYEASFQAYNEYIQAFNFKSMSYVYMPNSPFVHHKETIPRFSLSDTFSDGFLEEYEKKQYQHNDYIVDAVNKGASQTLYLWEQDLKNGLLNAGQEHMLHSIQSNHGMEHGFSILTRKNRSGVGAVTIVGDETDHAFSKNVEENAQEFHRATEIFHNHVMSRSYEVSQFIMPTLFSSLNRTERRVLKCMLRGLSVPKTADAICKSPRYIENLVRQIRLKIGGALPSGKPRITKNELIHFCGLTKIYEEL